MKLGIGFFVRINGSERFRIKKDDSTEQIEYVALQITTIIIDRVHTVENSIFREFIPQNSFLTAVTLIRTSKTERPFSGSV